MALQTGGEGAAPVCTLFVPDRDPAKAQWDGHRVAEEEAVLHHAADRAFPMAQFSRTLGKMAVGSQNLAFNLADWARSPMEPVVQSACRARPLDLNNYLSRVRWVKSDYELGEMRASASMAAEGFLDRHPESGLDVFLVDRSLDMSAAVGTLESFCVGLCRSLGSRFPWVLLWTTFRAN